jgi:hypothetical protein
MQTLNLAKELYSEAEAAAALNISIAELHELLDEHIFTDGAPRPERVEFRCSDLVLLGFWSHSAPVNKVVRMPRRA